MARQLNTGDPFPEYVVNTVDGRTLRIPHDLAGEYSVLVFYRHEGCPYCRRQLAEYQAHLKDFQRENVGLQALTAEPLEKAKKAVKELNLEFPVACGLDVPRDAQKIGAFWDEERRIFQPAAFILNADKKVLQAAYSTWGIGRITAEDALSTITQFLKKGRGSVLQHPAIRKPF